VTKRYTTPYPAFRQVFALGASEGAATDDEDRSPGCTGQRYGRTREIPDSIAVLYNYRCMTVWSIDEIIGHGADRKNDDFAVNATQFSSNSLRKIERFSGEKPVEITLKTLDTSAY
jgi:hypothetical protein